MLPFSKMGNSREEVLAWSKRNCDFRLNFKSLLIGSKTSLLIERGTITINTFLPAKKKFIYSFSVKMHASGFDELL